jgi:hypothetical protein
MIICRNPRNGVMKMMVNGSHLKFLIPLVKPLLDVDLGNDPRSLTVSSWNIDYLPIRG